MEQVIQVAVLCLLGALVTLLLKKGSPETALLLSLGIGVAALLFALSMAYLGRCVAISSTTKQIYRIREELARVTQTNEALEVQIAEKADDMRIQTIAINSLGMKQATEDVIYTVAPVAVASREESGQTDTAETVVQKTSGTGLVKDGFFGLLLHMIGL